MEWRNWTALLMKVRYVGGTRPVPRLYVSPLALWVQTSPGVSSTRSYPSPETLPGCLHRERHDADITGLSPEEHALLSMCPRHWVHMVKSRAQWLQRNTLVMGQTHEGSLTSPQHHRCVLPHPLHITCKEMAPTLSSSWAHSNVYTSYRHRGRGRQTPGFWMHQDEEELPDSAAGGGGWMPPSHPQFLNPCNLEFNRKTRTRPQTSQAGFVQSGQ